VAIASIAVVGLIAILWTRMPMEIHSSGAPAEPPPEHPYLPADLYGGPGGFDVTRSILDQGAATGFL